MMFVCNVLDRVPKGDIKLLLIFYFKIKYDCPIFDSTLKIKNSSTFAIESYSLSCYFCPVCVALIFMLLKSLNKPELSLRLARAKQ